jgi:hypothetical protein
MKKIFILLILSLTVVISAQAQTIEEKIVGEWNMSLMSWDDEILPVGVITFYEDGEYTINRLDGRSFSSRWWYNYYMDKDFIYLAGSGLYYNEDGENIIITPGYSDESAKYYILQKIDE